MVKGIDISRYNVPIDFVKVKKAEIDFVMIKAGSRFTADTAFAMHITNAHAAGLPVGVYWFAYALNTKEAIKEADCCHKTISKFKIDIPTVYYDFEGDTDDKANDQGRPYTVASRTAIIKTFCDRMISLGRKAGVYTNPDYLVYKLKCSDLKRYDLWLADWVTNGHTTFDKVNGANVTRAFGTVSVWQIGKAANIPGTIGDVDIDYGYFKVPDLKPITPVEPVTFNDGDVVKVINVTKILGITRGKTYSGGTFRIYNNKFNVIGDQKGDRVVIGIGSVVTAAVNAKYLQKA